MALPYLNPRASLAVGAALMLVVSVDCNSDDPYSFTTEVDLTTGSHTSDVPVFTTGEPDEEGTSTGEYDDPKQSCRKAIGCITTCALTIDANDPEGDLSCFRECIDGLTTAETLALIELSECVYNVCRDKMICTDHGENDDEACRNCVVVDGLANPNPDGCEAEGLACK